MNYLENLITRMGDKAPKLAKEGGTFTDGYNYWKELLFERAIRLFKWSGIGNIPQHEIEAILMMNGSLGATKKYKDKLVVFNGFYAGSPTEYFDEYEDYSIFSPVFSGIFKIGKDIEIIKNTALMTSIYPLVHRYAIMLAHTETSFINTLINGRDSGGVPIASTAAQKTAIENYRNSLCNGKVTSILDPAFSGVQFLSVDKNTVLNIKELVEVRENLLNAFYSDLGVKTAWNKKGNMINEEVEANNAMLLLNIMDMLDQRKIGCEKINKLFGTNWSVDISPEIKTMMEGDEEDERESERPMEDSEDAE